VESYLINQTFVFLLNLIGIGLGFWVFSANRRSITNQMFALMTFTVLTWIDFTYLGCLTTRIDLALLCVKIVFGAVSLFFLSAYFFSLYFPSRGIGKGKISYLDIFIFFIGIIFFLISVFSNWVIVGIEFKEWGTDFIMGKAGGVFYIMVIALTLLIIGRLFRKFFWLSEKEKLRIQYFLLGAFIFAIMNLIFNVILPIWRQTHEFYQFGNYSSIFLLGFTAYAVVKRELFGIKVILTSLLVGLIAILLLLDALVFTTNLTLQLFKGLILIIFLYFGYSLIKSVIREIQYREKLEKTYQELKKLDKAKSEFLSIVSHQLRTPLSAIKGYISMLLGGSYGVLPESSRKSIENVYQSNERLIKLVNDILNVSRIEAGRIEIDFQKISLEEIINSVIDELTHGAQIKNIYLKFKKPSKPLPQITADADKIRHAILNIIDNAIRYTDKGGVIIQAQTKNHNKMIIKVKDTGLGMTHKEIVKLFKSFSRGSAGNRSYTEGSGLGLYIAKGFVEMHHGKISAESDGLGKGSTFTIEIPLKNSL